MRSKISSMVSVSFCVTCYDGDFHLLGQCLHYIAHQTVAPDEVLIIASGLKKKSEGRSSTRVYTFENRMSAGAARNKGGELATSEVVCFCDVDDPIHPQKCEVIKRVFDDTNVDALLHNYNTNTVKFEEIDVEEIELEPVTRFDKRWEEKQKSIPPANYGYYCIDGDLPRTNVEIDSGRPATHGHMSARKEVLSEIKYIENMRIGEDGELCQSIIKSGKFGLYYTPLTLINYIT